MKRQISALKLVRETVRELSGAEMSQAAGGMGTSALPTCYCSSIPCGGLPTVQACIVLSVVCHAQG